MGSSNIEWTEQSWNPVVGCSIVSPGCTNCYAMKMAARIEAMGNQPRYAGTTRKINGNAVWTGKLAQAPDSVLLAPLKRKKPTTYFVNSMGDLFHEDCPDEWIDKVFAVMALSPQHTFQVLTKRAARMLKWFAPYDARRADSLGKNVQQLGYSGPLESLPWPLPNVWLGVSTERQKEADERIPLLLQTPAAVRFISAEPLLGEIDLTRLAAPKDPEEPDAEWLFDALATGGMYEQRIRSDFDGDRYDSADGPYRESKVDWVIVGGESGPNARPMLPDWARYLRDQCAEAGVAFFFKQWGEWAPGECADFTPTRSERIASWFVDEWSFATVTPTVSAETHHDDAPDLYRIGKARAGRHLDGVLHDAMPQADGRGGA